ncbi:MAG: hypothetical protein JSW27_05775 [Phycisphaerales bacterium]|nr:MAG: hypothetical protein JSW27_05775 [Phycisphaerales bacterium]
MTDPKRFWMPVLSLTVLFCALAAVACWVVPGVREGTVPAIGGLVWHALGVIQLLVTNVYGPVAARVGEATTRALGVAVQVALTGLSALLLSVAIWYPFYLVRGRSRSVTKTSDAPASSPE